ncbi:MAG TPA: hypothetical protein V6C69_21940 [Trichormus sp.]|jgi:hypothetical protein
MSEIPNNVSYGLLLETLYDRVKAGWKPDDHSYFNELAIQLIFAQRGVLRQVAKHLSQSSWLNGWSEPFSDRIGFDYQL